MEPGHEDREYIRRSEPHKDTDLPQWSPVMKTGNTLLLVGNRKTVLMASMEPGHEDREYALLDWAEKNNITMPQWSPVMKTGNTARP